MRVSELLANFLTRQTVPASFGEQKLGAMGDQVVFGPCMAVLN